MKGLHVLEADPGHEEYLFFCPACRMGHSYIVKWGDKSLAARIKREEQWQKSGQIFQHAPTWTFNGNIEKPTFTPSLLYRENNKTKCHLYVTDGIIQFLDDCDHALKGQSIPI